MPFKIYSLWLVSVLLCSSHAAGQNYNAYIDSIDQYRQHIDSLVQTYNTDQSVKLTRIIVHYSCGDGEMGGSADLFQAITKIQAYRLDYIIFCDSLPDERTYYFINKKIVLLLMDRKTKAKYYRNNELIAEDKTLITQPKANDEDLLKGYEILKDFSFKHY